MNEMIRRAMALKLHVVQQDLQDQGVRRLLNFGHTLGHALEASMQFRVSHGRAVAEGMLLELEGNPFYETVKALLNQYDCLSPLTYDRHQLIPFLRGDKKREGTWIDRIHLTALGEGKLVKEPFDQVSQRLRERK
jgi:3-dehydroquinate synthase